MEPVTYTFTEEEARLLNAFVCGACSPHRFYEDADYQLLWAKDCGVTDLDGLLRKLARLPSHRKAS
jgi:hypothetical protein